MATIDDERELLLALVRRHREVLPTRAASALSAAADELTDPLVLPRLVEVSEDVTSDLVPAVTSARNRLLTTASTAPTVSDSLAAARAARELGLALEVLQAPS